MESDETFKLLELSGKGIKTTTLTMTMNIKEKCS